MKGVGRGATKDRAGVFEQQFQPHFAAHAATGKTQRTEFLTGLEGEPKTQKRSKAEGEQDAILRRDPGRAAHFHPVTFHGVP